MSVGGVLLAAGAGRRLGGPKALVELDGELLVERGVRLLRDGGCDPVVVVVGAGAEQVRARARVDAEVVVNDDWARGMSTSLAAGLAALAGRCAAAVIALVDQPHVTPEAVRRLRVAWAAEPYAAVAAAYGGAPRNPVLLDARVWGEVVAGISGDEGARGWLRSHPDLVRLVECEDVADPLDVDTPEDLTRLQEEQPCS